MPENEPEATQNKAKDIETKSRIEKLWAEYGRLQARREEIGEVLNQQQVPLNQIVRQMQQIYQQIQFFKQLLKKETKNGREEV